MDIKNDEFVIIEIIPSNLKSKEGVIVQLSALKIKGLKLLDRFDYRLKDEYLPFPEMKKFISYDEDMFTYVRSDNVILNKFKSFAKDLPILILDNIYTPSFLEELDNRKELILNYLNLEYHKDIIDEIIKKYHLENSNHIVDLLYEALMMEY